MKKIKLEIYKPSPWSKNKEKQDCIGRGKGWQILMPISKMVIPIMSLILNSCPLETRWILENDFGLLQAQTLVALITTTVPDLIP